MTIHQRINLNVDNIMDLVTFVFWTLELEGKSTNKRFCNSHGQPSIPHCCERVDGGFGVKDHIHNTRGLPTEKLEVLRRRCNFPGSQRKGREITITHEHRI